MCTDCGDPTHEFSPDDSIQSAAQSLKELGWTAVFTMADPARKTPSFCYSLGFGKSLGIPDILIMGLGAEMSKDLLAGIFDLVKEGDITLPKLNEGLKDAIPKTDLRVSGILEGFDVKLKALPRPASRAICREGRIVDETSGENVLHLIIPDANRRFPGDIGVNQKFSDLQDINSLVSTFV